MSRRLLTALALPLLAVTATVLPPSSTSHSSSLRVAGDDTFLPNWMARLDPIIHNATILDLTLPGTHDSMTFDLSPTVSDDANDVPPTIAWLLHEFKGLLDLVKVGEFIRNNSITQGLNVTAQLDSGVRFIDFRISYTAQSTDGSLGKHDWYCLHFVETYGKALSYLQQVSDWMLLHPGEVIVIWVSRHGNPCGTSYPDVPTDMKVAFWNQVEAAFKGLMFDSRVSAINVTTYSQLIQRSHRAIFYVSDEAGNFTGGSPFHLNGCTIDNHLPDRTTDIPGYYNDMDTLAKASPGIREADKHLGRFFLVSQSASVPSDQLKLNAYITYDPFKAGKAKYEEQCAAEYGVPNMTYCPVFLQEASLLTNYYYQQVVENVLETDVGYEADFPHAYYIDGVDIDGTIRTGGQVYGKYLEGGAPFPGVNPTARYAFVDSLLIGTVRRLCRLHIHNEPLCLNYINELTTRRSAYPLLFWEDATYGRRIHWPIHCSSGKWANTTAACSS